MHVGLQLQADTAEKHGHDSEDGARVPQATEQLTGWVSQTLAGWRAYLQQDISLAALELAMLFFTVMSSGLLMTAYLKWKGINEARLSVLRGLGAVTGVVSTITFPWLHHKLGAVMLNIKP